MKKVTKIQQEPVIRVVAVKGTSVARAAQSVSKARQRQQQIHERILALRANAARSEKDMETFLRALRNTLSELPYYDVVGSINSLAVKPSVRNNLIHLYANHGPITHDVVMYAYLSHVQYALEARV